MMSLSWDGRKGVGFLLLKGRGAQEKQRNKAFVVRETVEGTRWHLALCFPKTGTWKTGVSSFSFLHSKNVHTWVRDVYESEISAMLFHKKVMSLQIRTGIRTMGRDYSLSHLCLFCPISRWHYSNSEVNFWRHKGNIWILLNPRPPLLSSEALQVIEKFSMVPNVYFMTASGRVSAFFFSSLLHWNSENPAF